MDVLQMKWRQIFKVSQLCVNKFSHDLHYCPQSYSYMRLKNKTRLWAHFEGKKTDITYYFSLLKATVNPIFIFLSEKGNCLNKNGEWLVLVT